MFVHRLRVRYSECDQQGVVFNAHYLLYYDLAVTELLRERVGSYQVMIDKGDDLMVAEARLRFLRPARFDDEIDVAMNVHHLGTTSIIVRPEFRIGDDLITEGEIRHVFVDATTLQKKPIPDYVRAGLSD